MPKVSWNDGIDEAKFAFLGHVSARDVHTQRG